MNINSVCFDSENKEYVKITNGIEKNGVLIPAEAIAIRFLGFDDDGKPLLAYTYRKVNPDKLSLTIQKDFFDNFHSDGKHYVYFGRV